MLNHTPSIFLRYCPRTERLAIWDKFSFSLRTVPIIINMNHFSYPLTIVQIYIFEELQNIFSQPKSQTPNYRASPPPGIFNYRVPPGLTNSIKLSDLSFLTTKIYDFKLFWDTSVGHPVHVIILP